MGPTSSGSTTFLTAGGFYTGLTPTPRHKLQAAMPHRMTRVPPPQFCAIPPKLSYWLNNQYGICVTAEECFAKAVWSVMCGLPELFISDQEAKRWASAGGYLNGAMLDEVMDSMIRDGFHQDGQVYGDGPYKSVDYSNEAVLQSALSNGPVKLGMDHRALPDGAGNVQGWYAFGGRPGQYRDEDHCTGLCGYGPTAWLAQQLSAVFNVTINLPGNAPPSAYLHFTWSTIGIVDHPWVMSTVGEAWLRTPTTPGQMPQAPIDFF